MSLGRKIVLYLLAIAVLTTIGVLYVRTTPDYSLYWFRNALEARDEKAFDYWVDADAVAIDLAKDRFSRLHGRSGYMDDPTSTPPPEAIAMVPDMRKVYQHAIRGKLLGQDFTQAEDRLYLLSNVARHNTIVEATFTPNTTKKDHRPWRVRLIQRDNGLWKVISLRQDL